MLFSKGGEKFKSKKQITLNIDDRELVINIKALPVNFQDIIAEELPYPELPKVFNKSKKRFEGRETAAWENEKRKIDSLRTYAVFVLGVEDEIEGVDLKDKIETLIETALPIGYFIEVVNEIQTLSGISDSEFPDSM